MSEDHSFRNLLEASVQGILVHRDFKVLFANQRAAEIAGHEDTRSFVGTNILDVVPEDERESMIATHEALMAGEDVANPFETRFIKADGSLIWVERVVCRVQWEGAPAVMGTAVDITDRKRAERERQAAFDEIVGLKEALQQERDYLREEIRSTSGSAALLGSSPEIQNVIEQIDAVARTQVSVLIVGESGTGKELVAREIHARSERAEASLVRVNCASVPRELFESEFFGHVRGAFTGAHKSRIGRFQLAHRGTLFLDEVGEIPIELQSKLLRVLQEGEFERIGDDTTTGVDVRIVAATNRDLTKEVAEGRFREDLFFRLNVFPISVPPLCERGVDVLELAAGFLEKMCRNHGRRQLSLSVAQKQRLMDYTWPGNIRELQNVIERGVILSTGDELRLEAAMQAGFGNRRTSGEDVEAEKPVMTAAELKQLEIGNLRRALAAVDWRVAGAGGAAELLGVSPSTLRDRIKSLGIRRAD